jgi:predicted AAA+ superfamily ATPase
MAAAVGVSVNTLRNYCHMLEGTFLGFRVLADLLATPDLVRTQTGELFEQWAMAELHYRYRYHGSGLGISTWRTSTGAEVDLVIRAGGGVHRFTVAQGELLRQRPDRRVCADR